MGALAGSEIRSLEGFGLFSGAGFRNSGSELGV